MCALCVDELRDQSVIAGYRLLLSSKVVDNGGDQEVINGRRPEHTYNIVLYIYLQRSAIVGESIQLIPT